MLTSMQTHVTNCIQGNSAVNVGDTDDKEKQAYLDIKRIVFSKNEKFMVLITQTQAVVLSINIGKFDLISQIDLPITIDYKTCDHKTLQELSKSYRAAQNVDFSKIPSPLTSPLDLKQTMTPKQTDEQKLTTNNQIEKSEKQRPASSKLSLLSNENISEATSVNGYTDTDDGIVNRRTTVKKIRSGDENKEKAEENRLQKEKECVGGGFLNTPWIAAIDDAGETLCLHTSDSCQIIKRIDSEDQNCVFGYSKRDKQLISELHVYTGPKFSQHTLIQVGHLCPDEILALELDNLQEDEVDFNDSVSNIQLSTGSFVDVDPDFEKNDKVQYSLVKRGKGRELVKIISASKERMMRENLDNESPMPNESTFDNHSNRNANQGSKTLIDKSEERLQNSGSKALTQAASPINFTTNLKSGDSIDNLGIKVKDLQISEGKVQRKVKNLTANNSSIDEADEMQIGSAIFLQDKVVQESQDYQSPRNQISTLQRLFKCGLNKTINVKCKNLMSYDLAFATNRAQLAETIPVVVLFRKPQKMPGGATIPTSLFRNPKFLQIKRSSKSLDEAKLLGFKALHYEHMREWIHRQERIGNIIKFSLIDSKYCVGFQKSTYNGMKPHYFVYEILKRKVVRRFLPLLDPFKDEWKDSGELFTIPNFQGEAKKNLASLSDFQGSTDQDSLLSEDFADDVSVFEVSPKGNFLVALVSNEFITLKMLNRSLSPACKKLLTPSFMLDEHIQMIDDKNNDQAQDQPQTQRMEKRIDDFISGDDSVRIEKQDDRNYVVKIFDSEGNRRKGSNFSSQSQEAPKNIAEQLVAAFTSYEDYTGSSFYKHQRFYKWYEMLTIALKDPKELIYPNSLLIQDNTSIQTRGSQSEGVEVYERKQILPKLLCKVLQAIKEFNFSYSVQTSHLQALSGNQTQNLFSTKVGVNQIAKLLVFDQFVFGRSDDKIKQIILSSMPKNWYLAVYFRRVLQVYEQSTGLQIFEFVCPSARKIAFIDNENLLAVLEGQSQVFICSVNSQRQAFLNREEQIRRGEALLVQRYEENMIYNQYTIGISNQRATNHNSGGKQSDGSESSDIEDDTIRIKVIVFDETIKTMVTSRNVSPYGYICIIGQTKISIYLAYAEDETCTYDHIWTINFQDLRKLNIGKRIELIDFSPNGQEFIAVSNTGELSIWSIKKFKFIRKITSLQSKQLPITELRTFANNQKCIAFSQPRNLLLIIDVENLNDKIIFKPEIAAKIKQIKPESEGFSQILSFQIDASELFLISTFSDNKVGLFSTQTAALLTITEDSTIYCDGSFIDESGSFISMLDKSKTKVNIYAIDWKYKVDPPPERFKKMITLKSLDSYEDDEELTPRSEVRRQKSRTLKKQQNLQISPSGRKILGDKNASLGDKTEPKKSRMCSIF